MVDFDSYIEEAVKLVTIKGGSISSAYHTGYIYGLRASKLIFKEYEQKSKGEDTDD